MALMNNESLISHGILSYQTAAFIIRIVQNFKWFFFNSA